MDSSTIIINNERKKKHSGSQIHSSKTYSTLPPKEANEASFQEIYYYCFSSHFYWSIIIYSFILVIILQEVSSRSVIKGQNLFFFTCRFYNFINYEFSHDTGIRNAIFISFCASGAFCKQNAAVAFNIIIMSLVGSWIRPRDESRQGIQLFYSLEPILQWPVLGRETLSRGAAKLLNYFRDFNARIGKQATNWAKQASR